VNTASAVIISFHSDAETVLVPGQICHRVWAVFILTVNIQGEHGVLPRGERPVTIEFKQEMLHCRCDTGNIYQGSFVIIHTHLTKPAVFIKVTPDLKTRITV
jgi:hypothetical protein